MTVKTLKEYGLEFLEELAKDRELTQTEVRIKINGAKKTMLDSKGQLSYILVDEFVGFMREEIASMINQELTRIAIKTLRRLRQIVLSGADLGLVDSIPQQLSSPESLEEQEAEIDHLQEQIAVIMREKNVEIRNQNKNALSAMAELEEARNTIHETEKESEKLKTQSKAIKTQLEDLEEQHKLTHDQLNKTFAQLELKDLLIENLVEQEKVQAKDIEVALSSVEEVYQSNEQFYQQMIHKATERAKDFVRREYQTKEKNVESRIQHQLKRSKYLVEQQKKTIQLLEDELLSTKNKNKQREEKSFTETAIQSPKPIQVPQQEDIQHIKISSQMGDRVLDYTERLLSTHPLYASVLILMNLGGSLDLPTLAKSVGAHPLKLVQMLEDVAKAGLITISKDAPPIIQIIQA